MGRSPLVVGLRNGIRLNMGWQKRMSGGTASVGGCCWWWNMGTGQGVSGVLSLVGGMMRHEGGQMMTKQLWQQQPDADQLHLQRQHMPQLGRRDVE